MPVDQVRKVGKVVSLESVPDPRLTCCLLGNWVSGPSPSTLKPMVLPRMSCWRRRHACLRARHGRLTLTGESASDLLTSNATSLAGNVYGRSTCWVERSCVKAQTNLLRIQRPDHQAGTRAWRPSHRAWIRLLVREQRLLPQRHSSGPGVCRAVA